MMKNRWTALICAAVTALGFCVIRWPLLELHGMLQWPLILAIVTLAVCAAAFLLRNRVLPVCAAGGYLVGFGAGELFHTAGTDPGGGKTDDLWLIWTAVLLAAILVGVVVSIVSAVRRRRS